MINLEELLGFQKQGLQPYNYERYKAVNPKLTKEVYEYLRGNGSEWKILCGLSITTHWGNEILKEVWYLKGGESYKETDFYKFRYRPEIYLALDSW